jgi:stringent starvation protein B
MESVMLSNRPYLLRAFYQWIVDSACTPILVIDAENPQCKIPMDYAEDGEIIFNIAPAAVRDLKIGNDIAEFKASFSGVIHIISVPVKAILALYAEENGEGVFFDGEQDDYSDEVVPSNAQNGLIPKQDAEQARVNVGVAKSKPILKLIE